MSGLDVTVQGKKNKTKKYNRERKNPNQITKKLKEHKRRQTTSYSDL
jgi:hypothetical protein